MRFQKGIIPFNKGKKKAQWEKTKVYTKICPTCKKEIKTERKNQIYCNKFCYFNSEKLRQFAKESKMIKNNVNNKYHKGYKHSQKTKNKIRDNPFRHSFIKGGPNPGINKSLETISKIKEKRLYQKILKKDTKPEVIIQNLLTNLNIKFTKHKPITNILHKYQCDIFIDDKIIIECDGDYYHNYPSGREIDKIRTVELKERGYKVLRLWEHEIKSNLNECKNKILDVLK
jgi:DNA mismatch endonuclease, patch repair protein